MVTEEWGKAVLCGNTAWDTINRKDKTRPDAKLYVLSTPHLIRELVDVKVTHIVTGPSSCHSVIISLDGGVWVFGRNEKGQLGLGHKNIVEFPVNIASVAQNEALFRGKNIIAAATGRHHTVLISESGEVFTAGENKYGQLGHNDLCERLHFAKVKSLAKHKVIAAACGAEFTLVCTDKGVLYAFGSQEYGQLGNGRDGQVIVSTGRMSTDPQPDPVLVSGLDKVEIVAVACGTNHSLALDAKGFVYSWGFGGYGRLGHNEPKDVHVPRVVEGMTGNITPSHVTAIACGATCSLALDDKRYLSMWGKWKTTGDGGNGQAWMYPRRVNGLSGRTLSSISAGAQSLLAVIDDDEPTTAAWGQVKNGELGFAEEEEKTASEPKGIDTLEGIRTICVSGGVGHTLFLVSPEGEKVQDLNKWPPRPEGYDGCIKCGKEDNEDQLLMCDKCDDSLHTYCAEPRLDTIPEGDWYCDRCHPPTLQKKRSAQSANTSSASKKTKV